ncbi:MAG: CusA/CzcA family heavy metal efflux RND transporter [Bryobacteraceae bacterium]|nr:CusA/CzcA family heavy metal efflux RND transporter [Bryobacteraceae bacterium]
MVARILSFALRQRFITFALAGLLIGIGLWALNQLKIEAYPDISDTQVVVITQYPGHAAEELEQQVTVPLERALNSTPGVIARRSRTIFGLSVVELTFENNTNDYFARQVVLEKLRDADLPDGVTPELGPMATPIGELYRYRVAGGGSPMERRTVQDWVVDPRFLQVPGVADVTPFGGLVKQYQVQIDPLALRKYDLSIAQVAAAVSANNGNAGGAALDNQQQSIVVRGVGLVRGASDIGNIVLLANNGVPVFVRDIGRVEIGPAVSTGIFGVGSQTGEVEGIVLMRRGENPSEVLKGIKTAVDDLNQNLLPKGMRILPIYDRTDLVENTLRTVSHTLLEGLAIVVALLLLFLGSARAALLTAITIPLSMLFAFICMHFAGIPANLLSLGALDFGVIVDGTLVMVEHIVRTMEEHAPALTTRSVRQVIEDAALEVESPIFFSLMIIISAYIPLFTLERVERRLFTPMAYTICFALFGSMLLALTLVPVLATFLFRNGAHTWENPLLGWVQRGYAHALEATLRRPWQTVIAGLLIVVGAFALGTRLGTEFLPQLDEGTLWVRANLPPGISLSESAKVADQIRALIGQSPEVSLVSSQSGRNDDGTDPYGPNRNEFFVALKPYDTWPNGGQKEDLIRTLSARLQGSIPGANFSFTQPIIDNVTEAVTGSPADLAVIISGPDLATLRATAERTLAVMRKLPGAVDTFIEQEGAQPQLRIAMDRDAIARYALNVADIESVIEMAIGGRAVSTMFEGERRFDITVRYVPEARGSIATIGSTLLRAPNGTTVPLSQLAQIELVNGQTIIARRDNRRTISVRTNIRGRDQGGFVAEAQGRMAKEVVIPPGYTVSWGGQFENLERASRRLRIILPVTIAIIFAILFVAFNSATSAAMVLINVPFSLVGGILLLWMRGIHLSVSAAVGFISLFGVAVMSGLLYIAEIDRRRRNPDTPLIRAIVDGATSQLRPRLILIMVALLGMVPAARATGIGSDVQRPLATVLVGGLLSTLFLTLLVLPSLYYLTARRSAGGSAAQGE